MLQMKIILFTLNLMVIIFREQILVEVEFEISIEYFPEIE